MIWNVQAVILAGGLGTRLREVTGDRVQKTMVEVAGKPFLHHLLLRLRSCGIRDIILCTGHLGEQIEEYFGDGSGFNMKIVYSREKEPMGTGGAVRLATPHIREDFFLLYGDNYIPYDLEKIYREFQKSGKMGLITVYQGESDTFNNVRIEKEDGVFIVKDYCKKESREGMNGIEAGLSVFKRDVLDLLDKERFSFEEYIFPKLINMRELAAYPSTRSFYDIGTPERLRKIGEIIHDDNK